MKEKQSVTAVVAARYRKVRKKQKEVILNEFIELTGYTRTYNDQLYRYCLKEQITFTRGRPYRKNDSCYVEQKNYWM